MNNIPLRILKAVISRYPAVVPHLSGKARWVAFTHIPLLIDIKGYKWDLKEFWTAVRLNGWAGNKTYDYFLKQIEGLIRGVYNNNLGGEFIDIMSSLIQGQLTQAFEQAWKDEEGEGDLPDYLNGPLEDMILGQYDFVDAFYRDIVDARVDKTPIDPLLARAPLWAQRWTEAYNTAVALITAENGGNLVWRLGETEQHCSSCSALDGIIAPASVWDELGVHPQGGPNPMLECSGFRCDCSLSPTDQRRSPKAYSSILNAVSK
jgi:hypothetical protein